MNSRKMIADGQQDNSITFSQGPSRPELGFAELATLSIEEKQYDDDRRDSEEAEQIGWLGSERPDWSKATIKASADHGHADALGSIAAANQ